MKSLFNFLTVMSLRFRAVTLALVVAVIVLGVISWTELQQELLPPIEFPQTIILAQTTGMTSEQTLNIMTVPIERELQTIPDIVNTESTTTSAVGSFIIAQNDFGGNQERIRESVQAALDRVWLPLRRIQPEVGQDSQAFADELLGDMTPDVLIYLAEQRSNFLFQLLPDVWSSLPADTVRAVAAYLAQQENTPSGTQTVLEARVSQEIVPQLLSIDSVANVSIAGGQSLPGDGADTVDSTTVLDEQPRSLLLQISPDVWEVIAPVLGFDGELNQDVVDTLASDDVVIPTSAPALPASWQMDRFETADDLLEITGLTRTIAGIFNEFRDTGLIVGGLGQTTDLTVDDVTRMLQIDPTMVNYFTSEHLAAMPADVFAVIPDDYIDGLDGFSQDELVSVTLAERITGVQAEPEPVALPNAWRIQPPQIITFSFADIPLATFSISSVGTLATEVPPTTDETQDGSSDEAEASQPETTVVQEPDIPVGPTLPEAFQALGITTADGLINYPVVIPLRGTTPVLAAEILNTVVIVGRGASPSSSTMLIAVPAISNLIANGGAEAVIGSLSAEVVAFLVEYDPTFLPNLSQDVFSAFSDDVMRLPQVAPPLGDAWSTLASRPQFNDMPLRNAGDLITIGNGQASTVLNIINDEFPERFSGYDVRLFDSLTPVVIRYLRIHEPGFLDNLSTDVVLKLNPAVLASLPQEYVESLDDDIAETVRGIANGTIDSAAAAIATEYSTDIPEADPDAPALNESWAFVGNFYGIELDTADDLFRFPEGFAFDTPAAFMNSFFESAQGTNFAPNLFGGLSVEAVQYIMERDEGWLGALDPQALQLLPDEVVAILPDDVQALIASGGEPFVPTDTVTRTNGQDSLLLTVYKTGDSNTVSTYHAIEAVLNTIDAENDNIEVNVVFETSTFVESSVEGVVREGSLGAVFAIIIILIFLSGGAWNPRSRRITGAVMVVVFAIGFVLLINGGLDAAGGDWTAAFHQADVVIRILLLLGFIAGLLALFWPGKLPDPSWRSTVVIAVSIPLSIFSTLALMHWLPPVIHGLLGSAAESSPIAAFILRLFPDNLTLNLMTLSGMTVAVGRIVDDSIVVLENIFRQMQSGEEKRQAIISGTRDVSVAIFSATAVAVVVFLPLGLTGGIISEFFLPLALAVTYALLSSFVVAISVVPVLAFILIDPQHVPEHHEGDETWMQRLYLPVLRWALATRFNQWVVIVLAIISMMIGVVLLATRPFAFLPDFGEPQISITVNMPSGTRILDTNLLVVEMEDYLETEMAGEIGNVQTTVGGGGLGFESLLGGGGGVSENAASMTIAVISREGLDDITQQIREAAERIFGEENVTVSSASIAEAGFGGFALVVSGLSQEELAALDPIIIETLSGVEGITNIVSNLVDVSVGGSDASATYIRINSTAALEYTGELETEDTLGVTTRAIEALESRTDLPDGVVISQGFNSELQTEGFLGMINAMGIAMVIVVVILVVTFRSFVFWLALILSVIVAPVGAAVALALTQRSLNVSALFGLLMLLGIVVTNAVVLIDRVQSNRSERGMSLYDALVEAGGRRLRPILMTALATMIALVPLAVGLSQGAIVAAELGTVVIGGVLSSTLLTLIVVPVAYSLLYPVNNFFLGLIGRREVDVENQ